MDVLQIQDAAVALCLRCHVRRDNALISFSSNLHLHELLVPGLARGKTAPLFMCPLNSVPGLEDSFMSGLCCCCCCCHGCCF
eukprot:2538608-Amphidinium_carterae.1